jgi:type 1 fimbriae regulatory protein FimB/type 1 fimbriae regulatory protein FimE
MKPLTADRKAKNFLTDTEIKQFLSAARKGAHGARDFALALLAYRHGFRVSELIDIRMEEVDLQMARIHVRHRRKSSASTRSSSARLWDSAAISRLTYLLTCDLL